MPTTSTDTGFVIDTPEGIAWYGLRAGIHRTLINQGPICDRPKNLALGVGVGFVIVFNTKSSLAYKRWNLDSTTTGQPATVAEIAKGLNLVEIARSHRVNIYDVSEKS